MIHVTLSAVTKKILLQQQQQFRCMGHTVRIICKQDLPNGKAYAGDVVRVRAGFARNYLIPQKIAMYATPQNFVLLNMKDPEMETPEERTARMQQEAIVGQDADLRASDLLTKYLKDKVLEIRRNVDVTTGFTRPGKVIAKNIKSKLNKHLRIELQPHESVHLFPQMIRFKDLNEKRAQEAIATIDVTKKCDVEFMQTGEFLACITLSGGYRVPLKFEVKQR